VSLLNPSLHPKIAPAAATLVSASSSSKKIFPIASIQSSNLTAQKAQPKHL
jgi:hypothetical protein